MKTLNALTRWPCLPLSVLLAVSFGGSPLQAQQNFVTANDADGDRIVDTVDVDDDNDGIPDILEIATNGNDIDTDRDGMPDRLDLDSDNDGVLDWRESGAVINVDFTNMRVVSGRILGEVGENGYIDALEKGLDNAQMRYSLVNTDYPADDLPDVRDLDSDNDGLTDLLEAGVHASYDANNDARIDVGGVNGSVGNDGIPDRLQNINDYTCCDVNGDTVEDEVPRNTDGGDFPDFQDLDSDNDGVSDLVEAGGGDFDRDGRVDNFFDSPVLDGMDDTVLLIPYEMPDNNGNAVPDYIDAFSQAGSPGSAEQPTNTPDSPSSGANDPLDQPSTDPEQPLDTPPSVPSTGGDVPSTVGEAELVERDPVPRPGSNILPGNGEQPSDDDAGGGLINTGLNASGCSVQSTGFDVILLLLSVLSITILGWRYTLRRMR